MKKLLYSLLTLGIVIALFGCASKDEEVDLNMERSKDNMEQVSEEIFNALSSGDFKSINKYWDSESKKVLTDEKLSQVKDTLLIDPSITSIKTIEDDLIHMTYIFYTSNEEDYRILFDYDDSMHVKRLLINKMVEKVEPTTTSVYTEEAVSMGFDELLNGMVTIPNGVENPPVVIMVQGSGPSNLNEDTYALSPFADISKGLAERGIATIRYDKRTYDYPEYVTVDKYLLNYEYYYDVSYAIHYAQVNYPDSKIYLLGHSQGAILAPYINHMHPELNGIIMMAGSVRGVEEISKDQQLYFASLEGKTSEEIQAITEIADENIEIIKELKEYTENQQTINGLYSNYWVDLNTAKGNNWIDTIETPILVLQGEADFQVTYKNDFLLMKNMYEKRNNMNFISYPGLSHYFVPNINGTPDDYNTSATINEEVINDIAIFINGEK